MIMMMTMMNKKNKRKPLYRREDRREQGKGKEKRKEKEKEKVKKTKKTPLETPEHEPFKLDVILNTIECHGALKQTVDLYPEAPLYNRETIEQAIIILMMNCNLTLSHILYQLSESLSNALIEKKDKAIKLEVELGEQALIQV